VQKQPMVLMAAGVALLATGIASTASRPAFTASQPGPAAQASALAISNVRLFDGERVTPRTTVVVKDGLIASVGGAAPQGAEIVDGAGKTLVPGLIDAHTHAFGDALARALVFGVTTELDMFTDHRFAGAMRAEQRSAAGAPRRADLFSAGTLVTAPKGHGTEYGMAIPTIASPGEAAAFVDARIAEGSDYIKIVYDNGDTYGLKIPTIDRPTMAAAIEASRARKKLAVVHIGSRQGAEEAIDAGASGLIHIFADAAADPAWVARVAGARAFVTPTLTVTESSTGVAGAAGLPKDARLARFVTPQEATALAGSFPWAGKSKHRMANAFATTKLLYDAGVPILAGTDAPNPGTAHGVSMHRELELLVQAGLTPQAALAAATSVPARVFGLADRGRIAQGMRADLLLVEGDPTTDITATRDVVAIWKRGARVERPVAPKDTAAPAAATTTGIVSAFESAQPSAEFGAGWQISTDTLMGGTSQAAMATVPGGANGTTRALEVTGTIVQGAAFSWAGAMFFPADPPMTPANLSKFKELVFWARGDGGEHQVMLFAARLGNIPAMRSFTAGPEWREHVIPLASFSNVDGSDIRGLLFSAGSRPGAFRFQIDEVRFR
jgi:imidazolonepropionase-like amidohydrolase